MRRRTDASFDLDLVPILSLIVHLLPMLLLVVRFVSLSEHPVSQPPARATEAPSREKLDAQEKERVVVRIGATGFVVTGAGEGDLPIPCTPQPCAANTYNYAALRDALSRASGNHPGLNQVLVVPEANVTYAAIIGVFDVARGKKDEKPLFSDPVLVTGAKAQGAVDAARGAPLLPASPAAATP